MTRKEIGKILTMIAAGYPRFEVNEMTGMVWMRMIGDLDYEVAETAVMKHMSESQYPPSIAEIRKAAATITSPGQKTSGEAWAEVERAVRLHGYYSENAALSSMSPLSAKAVKAIGWQDICLTTEPGVVRAHFMRIYDQLAQREQQNVLLPAELREQITQIGQPERELKAIEGGRKS